MARPCRVLILASSFLFALATAGEARQAGVASAVVPESRGTPPQEAPRVLQVGIDMQVDERVETGERGKTQLLFLDGSALTVGPNSDVTLDRFVYDPDAGSGDLALTATKGLFRFVGGRISKTRPVLLKTPTATIGIRGGIITARVSDTATRATFHFGDQMSVSAAGVTKNTQRPGNAIAVEGDGPPSDPAPVTTTQLSEDLGGLEKSEDDAPGEVGVGDSDVAETQISELGSSAAPDTLGGGSAQPAQPAGGSDADDNADLVGSQNDQRDDSTNATPGITGATIANLVGGRGKRGTSTSIGTLDTQSGQNFALTDAAVNNGLFTASTSAGNYRLFVPDTAGSFTLGDDPDTRPAETPFGTTTGTGLLSDNKDFVLFELSGSRQIVFGGVETPASNIPTTPTSDDYLIRPDFALGGSNIPGLPADLGGDLKTTETPAFILWDNTGSTGFIRPVFAGAMAVTGTGSSQKSAVGVLIGQIVTTSDNKTLIAGGLGGSSSILGTLRLFEGGGSSATNDTNGGFFGANGPDFAVLEGRERTATGATDTTEPLGVEVVTAGTPVSSDFDIFPNLVLQRQATSSGFSRAGRTVSSGNPLKGYASGILNSYQSDDTFFRSDKLLNQNTGSSAPADVVIQTDINTSRVEATFNVKPGLSGGPLSLINLTFGGLSANPLDSAYFDDDRFGAYSITGQTTLDGLTAQETEVGLARLRQSEISLGTDVLPSGVSLCTCSFAKWGFWTGSVEESNGDEHFVHLATWVASEVTTASQIPTTGTANYVGPVLGSVVEGSQSAPTAQYFTGGNANLSVSFGSSTFTVTGQITNLAGATFDVTSSPVSNSNTAFVASLHDNVDPTGFPGIYSGTFNIMFSGGGTPPEGQIGQAAISNANSPVDWQFSGIYMGEKQ